MSREPVSGVEPLVVGLVLTTVATLLAIAAHDVTLTCILLVVAGNGLALTLIGIVATGVSMGLRRARWMDRRE